jgi:protein phosphatase
MRIEVGFFTHTGRVRDNNEDSFVVDERLALFAVADGMGGHRGGEVASKTAVEALRAAVAGGRTIDDAVRLANDAVIEKAAQDPEQLAGMGTTMTAAVPVGGSTLLIGHVGDSRAYLLRDGTLELRTQDHSLVEELVREGRLTPEQAESHPQRAIVTRALGVDEEVEVDLYTIDVRTGDRVLLCSDGLTTMLRDREVERIARGVDDPQRCAEDLVNAAVEAGGEDNVTVVVLDVVDVDEAAPGPDALAETGATDAPGADGDHATDGDAEATAGDTADEEVPVARAAPRQSRRRRATGIALVVIPILFIVAVALGAIAWYDRHNYYLAAVDGQVVVYKGRPDPVLWSASRLSSPKVRVFDLTPQGRANVRDNISFDTKGAALSYLRGVTTTTTTTSTTIKRTTTTTAPRAPRATTSVPGP